MITTPIGNTTVSAIVSGGRVISMTSTAWTAPALRMSSPKVNGSRMP